VSDAESRLPLEIDGRERAALLWDQPTLLGISDEGSRQWRDALGLNFVNLGELDPDDTLSVASHIVLAAMSGGGERLFELREVLRSTSPLGQLFELLLGLVLDLDDPESAQHSLSRGLSTVFDLSDQDLRSRLLVRLAAYAELRQAPEVAQAAILAAVQGTREDTRLGVVARRYAVHLGADVPNFNAWAPSDTQEDPLLSLPWVQHQVIKATAAIQTDRFERHLAGMWDSRFHIGSDRTPFVGPPRVRGWWM